MKRLLGWTVLIFGVYIFFILGSSQLPPYNASAWERFTSDCSERGFCWYQISSVHSSADRVVSVVSEFLPPNVVSDQSVQWRHPEGYEGYARFNENTIASMEIRFPADLAGQDWILVGDVILGLGMPDEVEIAPSGHILLHYHELFLVVRVRTGVANHLKTYHSVARIQLFSPYNAAFNQAALSNTTQTKSERYWQWRGFGNYLFLNP